MEAISTESWIAVGSICFSQVILSAIFLGIISASQVGAAKAKGWSTTTGTILMSTLEARRGNKGHWVNYPVVLYRYRVGSTDYESRKIMPGMEWGGSGAPAVVARYPTGSQVPVYYDPANPAEALLERKAPSYNIWLWVALILSNIFMGGLAVLLFFTL